MPPKSRKSRLVDDPGSSSNPTPLPCISQPLGSCEGNVIDLTEDQATTNMQPTANVLSDEQQLALKAVLSTKSVFITGSAGVGKSFLLREIMNVLPESTTYITASTGVAACNISGTTLHSFAGVGLGTAPVNQMVSKIKYNKDTYHRWQSCRTLVIDEISMIDGEFFEKIEELAKKIRKSRKPFGGIQLILCGDFLQLPPVMKQGETKRFCFETGAWKSCVQHTVNLKKVFRQKEEDFIGLLNRVRIGQMTEEDVRTLDMCRHTTFPNDGIKATILFPDRHSCERVNSNMLQALTGRPYVYRSIDTGNPRFVEELNRNSNSVKVLTLKENAQVILLKNLDVPRGLVNGARGFVVGFQGVEEEITNPEFEDGKEKKSKGEQKAASSGPVHPIVRFSNGVQQVISGDSFTVQVGDVVKASRLQIPLALAWALSIHKSQGMTLERVELSLGRVFESGQAYVALSRVTSLQGLLLRDFNPCLIRAHPKVLSYYETLDPSSIARPQTGCNRSINDALLSNNSSSHKPSGAYKRPSSAVLVGSQSKRAFGLGVNVPSGNVHRIISPVTDLKLTGVSSQNSPQVGSLVCAESRTENSTQQNPGSTRETPWGGHMPSLSSSSAKSRPSSLSEEQRDRIERNRRAALERRQASMNRSAVR